MKRHKHADVIIAWANGSQIQFKQDIDKFWRDTNDPQWNVKDFEFRVKLELLDEQSSTEETK
jgi:hypothetical protein